MAQTNQRSNSRSSSQNAQKNAERKEARAAAAVRHTAEMHDRFSSEIERSAREARFYDAVPPRKAAVTCVPKVTVVDQDSVAAVLERGRGIASACDLAVLDFASFLYAGGGYDRGAVAQEEDLCKESFLYNVLKGFGGWYADNRRRNVNCELYRDRAIVVPKVRFEREKYHSYADVIVAAAPNLRRARENYHVKDEDAEKAMRSRIRLVMGIADDLGHKQVVLGAFGCGVFGWDAPTVAEMFREELATGNHVAETVVFAVPKGRRDENLERFEHAFAAFPEKNSMAYNQRLFVPEPVTKPVEDEEEDDDWKKYL